MKRCGDFGGQKTTGGPCGRRAGWGTDRDDGRCRHHPEDVADQELTPKQALFVEEYLVDRNATQAAIRAGYSPDRAKQTGHDLLHLSHVRARIRSRVDEHFADLGLQQRFLIGRLAAMAGADISDYVEWDGRGVRLKDSSDLPLELTPLIKSVKETRDGVALEIHDQMSAIKILMEYHDMLRRGVDVRVTGEVSHRHSQYEEMTDEELFGAREEAIRAAMDAASNGRQNGNGKR